MTGISVPDRSQAPRTHPAGSPAATAGATATALDGAATDTAVTDTAVTDTAVSDATGATALTDTKSPGATASADATLPDATSDRASGEGASGDAGTSSTSDTAGPEPAPLLPPPVVADRPAMPMTTLTAEAVIWPVRVASEWAARLLIIALGFYVLLLALSKVSLVAFAVVVALFLCAVLHPVETRLRVAFGGRKSLSTAVTLLGGIAVLGLISWFVIAQISSHYSALADQVSAVGDKVRQWLRDGPANLNDADVSKAINNLTKTIRDHQGQLASSALSTVSVLIEILGGIFLALISTFFLLRDGEQIWRWVLRLMPRAARERVDYAGQRGWNTLGGYIRGQVSIAVIHAVTIFIALLILRVPLAAALGVLIFLGSFIPILGLTLAGALCVGITLLEHGVTAAIVILIIIIALVQLEGNVLQPFIMSRAVHIHPLAVALSVTAGTIIYGIIGALIAVPLVAFTNSFVRGLRNERDDVVTESQVPGPAPAPS